jgi:hypothetical protein
MATLLDSHSSCFSILESTFQLASKQIVVNPSSKQIVVNISSKRLVSMNPFKFLANYMVVLVIVSMIGVE